MGYISKKVAAYGQFVLVIFKIVLNEPLPGNSEDSTNNSIMIISVPCW